MKFGELIEQAILCIQSFNPVTQTVDSHAEEFLKPVSYTLFNYLYSLKTKLKKYLSSKYFMDAFAMKSF